MVAAWYMYVEQAERANLYYKFAENEQRDQRPQSRCVSSRTMMHRKMFKTKEACEVFYILANEQKISHRNVVQQELWIEQLAEPVAGSFCLRTGVLECLDDASLQLDFTFVSLV